MQNPIFESKPGVFVIQGPLELDTKLSSYEANLELFRVCVGPLYGPFRVIVSSCCSPCLGSKKGHLRVRLGPFLGSC